MGLELIDIHKHFGPVRANDGISITVEEGTLHGLLGESSETRRKSQAQPADVRDLQALYLLTWCGILWCRKLSGPMPGKIKNEQLQNYLQNENNTQNKTD